MLQIASAMVCLLLFLGGFTWALGSLWGCRNCTLVGCADGVTANMPLGRSIDTLEGRA